MNQNLPRWLHASVADAMKAVAETADLPCLVEGIDDRTDAFMHAKERVEVRITGPFVKHPSNGFYHIFVDVNVLLSSRTGESKNAYDLLRKSGMFLSALDEPIGVWNYGNEPGDYVEDDPTTQVSIGCLTPRPGRSARLMNFGLINPVDQISQHEVENNYEIELTE